MLGMLPIGEGGGKCEFAAPANGRAQLQKTRHSLLRRGNKAAPDESDLVQGAQDVAATFGGWGPRNLAQCLEGRVSPKLAGILTIVSS